MADAAKLVADLEAKLEDEEFRNLVYVQHHTYEQSLISLRRRLGAACVLAQKQHTLAMGLWLGSLGDAGLCQRLLAAFQG